jgi:hypothetical protein
MGVRMLREGPSRPCSSGSALDALFLLGSDVAALLDLRGG